MKKKFIWKDWKIPNINILQQASLDNDFITNDDEEEDESILDISNESGIKMFILHTNFIIVFDILEEIINKKIHGLEVLKPLTSYKLLVGIPESGFFSVEKVKKEIEKSFLEMDEEINSIFYHTIVFRFNEEVAKSAEEIRKSLYDSQDYWILYVYPNGQFEIITDVDKTDYFMGMLETLSNLYMMIGGVLLSSLSYDTYEQE